MKLANTKPEDAEVFCPVAAPRYLTILCAIRLTDVICALKWLYYSDCNTRLRTMSI